MSYNEKCYIVLLLTTKTNSSHFSLILIFRYFFYLENDYSCFTSTFSSLVDKAFFKILFEICFFKIYFFKRSEIFLIIIKEKF